MPGGGGRPARTAELERGCSLVQQEAQLHGTPTSPHPEVRRPKAGAAKDEGGWQALRPAIGAITRRTEKFRRLDAVSKDGFHSYTVGDLVLPGRAGAV